MSESLELDEPSQSLLRGARKLVRAKERKATGRFLAEGRQAVREALHLPGAVESLFVRWANAHDNIDLIDEARASGVPVFGVSEQNIATLSDTVTPQGVIAVCRNVDVPLSAALNRGAAKLVVICDQIRDPGNAGSVIRAADAFGADAVILSEDSVNLYNPKVVRASVGSLFHLPIVTGIALPDAVAACRAAGLQVLATEGETGTALTQLGETLAKPSAWVMGNEAWGLPSEIRAQCDDVVRVPIHGKAESLNLAMAATVCLYASAGVLAR